MGTERLEAFSDGVLAIIITIMVLELKIPHGTGFHVLLPVVPIFFSYVLSFIYIAIYWNNHHHMLKATKRVNGAILWANMHLLFWLSLIPFTTGWMGENHFAAVPSALYGVTLLMAAIAYFILQGVILSDSGKDSQFAKAIGRDWKGKISLVFYISAIISAFFLNGIALGLYIVVALMWLVPDRRIEKNLFFGQS